MKAAGLLKDIYLFIREFVTEFQSTGTLCPTSRWAAQALASPIRSKLGDNTSSGSLSSRQILEVGPGTGAVTFKILAEMGPSDYFTICEINPRFVAVLKQKLEKCQHFQPHRERVTFFQGPIQDLPEDTKFNIIICALPFLNFDTPMIQEIFLKLKRLSMPETIMTYYEYIGLRAIGLLVPFLKRRARFQRINSFFSSVFTEHLSGRQRIWLNFPPINIYELSHLTSLNTNSCTSQDPLEVSTRVPSS